MANLHYTVLNNIHTHSHSETPSLSCWGLKDEHPTAAATHAGSVTVDRLMTSALPCPQPAGGQSRGLGARACFHDTAVATSWRQFADVTARNQRSCFCLEASCSLPIKLSHFPPVASAFPQIVVVSFVTLSFMPSFVSLWSFTLWTSHPQLDMTGKLCFHPMGNTDMLFSFPSQNPIPTRQANIFVQLLIQKCHMCCNRTFLLGYLDHAQFTLIVK